MIAPRLLRTRVARRILALFLLCALLPVATFAVLGYSVVAGNLEADAREQLRQGSKAAGLVLFDRLQVLSSQLASLGALRSPSDSSSSFSHIMLQHRDGRVIPVRGSPVALPRLTPRQQEHLALGKPVLIVGNDSGPATLFVALADPAGPEGVMRFWGVTTSRALLGREEGENPAPPGTELCVLGAGGRRVSCQNDEAADAATTWSVTPDREPSWQRSDSLFLMARWNLFLSNAYSSPTWTVALSRPSDAVMAPLRSFRRVSLLATTLAGLLVFLLSHSQLRRRMTPLAELESGVQRISAGDFSVPITIHSKDEFEFLAQSFNGMARDLQARMRELTALGEGALVALARTVDAHSPWTAGHSERVTQGAMELARRLGYDASSLDRIRRGGLLHDIGKIGVPTTILNKAGSLTQAERFVVQSHCSLGAEIIKPIEAFHDLIPLVLSHHELLDGSGYPEGLVGEAIPDIVRVLTVADVFDALVSDRPYRAAMSRQEALSVLREGTGRLFDAKAVGALEAALTEGWSWALPPAARRANPIHLEMVA